MGCAIFSNARPSLADKVSVAAALQQPRPAPLMKEGGNLTKQRRIKKQNKINGRVSGSQQVMHENVRLLPYNRAYLDPYRVALSNILRNHFFFANIIEEERSEIIKRMRLFSGEAGAFVFRQGDTASAFFIIHQGTVEVDIGGSIKKTLGKGDYFGELALIYSALRSASIKCITPCMFWCLTRSEFKDTLESTVRKNYSVAKQYISALPLFSFLTEQQKDSIAYSMLSLKYENAEVIFKERDDANSFYIITSGSVDISIRGKQDLTLLPGDSFGQQSFLENQFRSGTATSRGHTTCLSIGRESIKEILGDQITNIIYYNISKWAIKRSEILSKLSNIEIQKILRLARFVEVRDGEMVLKRGTRPDRIVICLEGSVSGRQPGSIVAEQAIKTNSILTKDLIKEGAGMLSIIGLQDLQRTLNKNMSDIVQKSYALTHEKLMVQQPIKQDFSYLKLQRMAFIKKLGEGQFGKVFLVKDLQRGTYFAIKCISKHQVVKNRMELIIHEERNILTAVNSPFLVHFYRSFKDSHYIYFLMEYIKGCELFETIREIGLLSRNIAKFYIASLVLCIEYLHIRSVIYRDLKPENVMVETNGYLRLIDMGTAKQLKQVSGFRTFTIIGTPHYMAPEVMLGKGYSFAVDIWSIGVVMYEFVCGSLPFGQNIEDPYELHRFILRSQLVYPSFYTDPKGKALINQMLQKRPETRINRGFAALKASPYFDGFDWQALYEKRMKSPYVPKKLRAVQKLPEDAGSLMQYLAKQKNKLPPTPNSMHLNWDADF